MAPPLERLKSVTFFIGNTLKPDIPVFWSEKGAAAAGKPNKIAYLDGLRGMAALWVYLTHHTMYSHKNTGAILRAFGYQGNYYFATFPGIRLFFSGGAYSVGIFFVISGYVLSIGPLNMLHSNQIEKLANSLGTGLPRRFVRLYFPVVCVTFLVGTSWHLFGIRSSNGATPAPRANYFRELKYWMFNFFHLSFIYGGDVMDFDRYNPHLWNIPAQLRGMVVVNAMLGSMLAFNSWGVNARLWAMVGATFYFLVPVDGWYCAQFIVGMLICELEILAEKEQLPRIFYRMKRLTMRGWLWTIIYIIAIWVAGVPRVHRASQVAEQDPGWQYTDHLVPPATVNAVWYWQFWAASLTLISLPRVKYARAFFELPFCLWLGKLSFGLYLVHGPVLWTVGDRLYAAVGRANDVSMKNVPNWVNAFPLPDWGPLGLEVNTIAVHLVTLPLSFWLASIAYKLFDVPGAQLANWLFDPKRFAATKPEERQGLVQHRQEMAQQA